MGSFSEDEEYLFFDAKEDNSSVSDANSDIFGSNSCSTNWFPYNLHNNGRTGIPRSVEERRDNFLRWMGLNADQIDRDSYAEMNGEIRGREFDRTRASSGAVLRTTSSGNESCSSWSLVSCLTNSSSDVSGNLVTTENSTCIDGKLGYITDCSSVEHFENMKENHAADLGGDVLGEFKAPPLSPSSLQVIEREVKDANRLVGTTRRIKKGWVNSLCSMSCIVDREGLADKSKNGNTFLVSRVRRVKVRPCKKQLKELSALYMQQDIQAHEGAILTMKFSPDGQYLASAGEDGVLRVWKVVEDERAGALDIPEIDPSCFYFTVNHLSELKLLFVDKNKMGNLRKTSDSACVIFPLKVFRILDRPIHEFHGHTDEILDLSWSKNNVSNFMNLSCTSSRV